MPSDKGNMPIGQIKKPIAVLTNRYSHAIDYLVVDMKIRFREIPTNRRTIFDEKGQSYVIITEPRHLQALEISEILVVPGASRHPRYSEMYDLARTRIR